MVLCGLLLTLMRTGECIAHSCWPCCAPQGVELAEMQCAAPAAALGFSHADHAHAERAARRHAGVDGMAAFQPGGPYLPFGPAGFHPGAGR